VTNNVSGASSVCHHLTVNGTLSCGSSMVLSITGNYTVSGTESGTSGQINFNTQAPAIISGSGSFSTRVRYIFYKNMTIASGTTIVKTIPITITSGIIVTNQGTVTLATVYSNTNCGWINDAGASLTLTATGFLNASGSTLVANAVGNTITYSYSFAGENIKIPTVGYYNLTLSGTSATRAITADLNVGNNFANNTGSTFRTNGFNVNVGGNFLNSGTFTPTAGRTVTFNGTAAQTISGSGTTTFEGLTINNAAGVSISSGAYLLNEVLTITSGTFNTGGNSFTMASTASKTARIAQSTGTIAGNFTVQRYITTRDTTWADLASPVQSTTFNDWDNELPAISYYVEGPTQYTFNETADDFVGITSSGTALTPGVGYEVFLSGNYSYGNLPNTIINTIGTPTQGNQSYGNPVVSFNNAGSNLVGNPFASAISWDLVLAASVGLNASIDMYDYVSGNYATFGAGTIIPPTQGFWVYANAAPTLNIPESAKVADPGNTQIRSAKIDSYFTLTLASNDNTTPFYHTLKFNAAAESSDGWDNSDHPFRRSPVKSAPYMYNMIEGKKSVINTFNSFNEAYSIPFNTKVSQSGYYKITADGFAYMSDYASVKLEDKLLNKMIDLTEQNEYSFTINASDKSDRFVLHFNKNENSQTPLGTQDMVSDFINQVEVLPSAQGNIINFNLNEVTNTTITVTNMLGQNIIDAINVNAGTQSVNVSLPEGYNGIYLLNIHSEKGNINKKFVKR
ncbi:MAG: T9SS type A sorting domain-containing protein, partial [Bacteroidota bacterium]